MRFKFEEAQGAVYRKLLGPYLLSTSCVSEKGRSRSGPDTQT